ncbi:MAG: hypothetical protein FWF78_08050 [Defluviitaleaceae bacterium]|nr:hypothetical protein [Defluviitaleaceae bacterium]
MTNRDECIALLDNFGEEQLGSVLVVLKSMKDVFDNALEEALDEAYCQKLYQDYLDDPDPSKHDSMTLEEFADSLGIALP